MKTFKYAFFALLLALSFVLSCKPAQTAGGKAIRMATTSSTDNSGLLDVLVPAFEKKSGKRLDVLVLGTGKALETARLGNVDLVFVHARAKEDEFVKKGWGVSRRDVMKNDFIILGPAVDPAGIKGMADAAAAFKKIAAANTRFISRGDKSGTHYKETAIWEKAGLSPDPAKEKWYISSGAKMGDALKMANEKNASILSDRGTYLNFKAKNKSFRLVILVQGDPMLANPYGIIAVNLKKHPNVNHAGAMEFINWITSADGQKLINGYRLHGEQLFYGTAVGEAHRAGESRE